MTIVNQLHPLKFHPILKPVLWGGNRIASYKHLSEPCSGIGESWEVSGVSGSVSVVSEGTLAGHSLTDLLRQYRELLVGESVYQRFGDEFPLLLKFIDAWDDLSVQVHPSDEMARKRHQAHGKTEMWYILEAQPEAFLYAGFNRTTHREEFTRLLEENRIEEVLNKEPVSAGDVFFLPAGRIHAIGKGIFLAEVQQTSDVTYRVWDYNRKDAQGRLRELHVDLALDALDYYKYSRYRTPYTRRINRPVCLQQCRYFTANLLEADTFMKMDYKGLDSFVVWMCVEGSAVYASSKKHKGYIRQGESILFPASNQPAALIPDVDRIKILEVYIG